MTQSLSRQPDARQDGYLPIGGYAAIGDGRTAALVGCDGTIDWLCLPGFDGPFVLGALVDADRGGRFTLAPTGDYAVKRRYVPDTNVLESTFSTASGSVRVTDALTLSADDRPVRELARRVEGVDGDVDLAWSVAPRFDDTQRPARIDRTDYGAFVARGDDETVVVQAWGAGEALVADGEIRGHVVVSAGDSALLVLAASSPHAGSLPFTTRDAVALRLTHTMNWWRSWCGGLSYEGPWREQVLRSALVLKLLVDGATGAMVAAPTMALPERVGGPRNWDYRYCWLRDSSFAVDALLHLGDTDEAKRFFAWLMDASREDHPRLHPFYRLDGTSEIGQRHVDVRGYRDSRPVIDGNRAVDQRQLGNYGDLLQAAALYVDGGHDLDREIGERLAELADHVCEVWSERDSGVWELETERHYTSSKMLCWVALCRAQKLAACGAIPSSGITRWRDVARDIRRFVEDRCWSDERASYVRSAGSEDLDAAVLLGVFFDYAASNAGRFHSTVDALRAELGRGPLLYRYSEMIGAEGTFLACSYWLAHALARLGRVGEAAQIMDEMAPLANDVGLYAEELDPISGSMLGNFPQGLTHLALINAAVAIAEASGAPA